jgi:hypothetical protein
MDAAHSYPAAEPSQKRRKVQQPSSSSNVDAHIYPLPVPSQQRSQSDASMDATAASMAQPQNDRPVYVPGSVAPLTSTGRFDSVGSLGSIDQDLLADLFSDNFDATDDIAGLVDLDAIPDKPSSDDATKPVDTTTKPATEASQDTTVTTNPVDPKLVKKLQDSLAVLPPQMQELFVDRTVAAIASPEAFQHQVDAVTALAQAAAEEAKKRVEEQQEASGGDVGTSSDEAAVPLAAATLGAFLTQYASAMDNNNNSGRARADNSNGARPSIVPM